MQNSTKIFIASLIIFACSLGFFAGAFYFQKPCAEARFCSRSQMQAPHEKRNFHKPPHFKEGEKHFDKRNKHHKGFNKNAHVKELDEFLQVTPEQKVKLDEHRAQKDSLFKIFQGKKKKAEKDLQQALKNKNETEVQNAKEKLLEIEGEILNSRIAGIKEFNEILTEEQQGKINEFWQNKKKNRNHK